MKGYGSKWQQISTAWIQRYPVCVWCLVHGDINRGAEENPSERQRSLIVDHIQPHHGDKNLMWNERNWETLCRYPCHDRYKRQWERQGKDGMAWLLELQRMMRFNKAEHLVREWLSLVPEHIQRVLTCAG
jgi:hypothetical protein